MNKMDKQLIKKRLDETFGKINVTGEGDYMKLAKLCLEINRILKIMNMAEKDKTSEYLKDSDASKFLNAEENDINVMREYLYELIFSNPKTKKKIVNFVLCDDEDIANDQGLREAQDYFEKEKKKLDGEER